MSLLDRINERNGQARAQVQQVEQAEAAEAAKPDATQQAAAMTADRGQMVAQIGDRPVGEEAASPEEQELFSAMEVDLMKRLNQRNATSSLMKLVRSSADPVEAVGQAANDLVKVLVQSHPEAAQNEDILLEIGTSAVEQVTELVEAASPQIDLTEDQMAEAVGIAASEWMKSNPNGVDDNMLAYLEGPAPQQI